MYLFNWLPRDKLDKLCQIARVSKQFPPMQAFPKVEEKMKRNTNFISQNVSTDVSLECHVYCNIMMYFKGTPN